jgi:hypothetical protein
LGDVPFVGVAAARWRRKRPVRRATVREIATGSNFATGAMRAASMGGSACRQAVAYAMAWRAIDDCDLGTILTHTGGYPGYGSVVKPCCPTAA